MYYINLYYIIVFYIYYKGLEDKVGVVEDKVGVVEDKVGVVEDKVGVVDKSYNNLENKANILFYSNTNYLYLFYKEKTNYIFFV
jgi:hypothetical protein